MARRKPQTNVETFTFKKGKIRIDHDTGMVTDQKKRRLSTDERIHDEMGFTVPNVVLERIQAIQDSMEAKYYDAEIAQAMEEARTAKLAEIRARRAKAEKSGKPEKPPVQKEVVDDDFDEDGMDDDFDEPMEPDFDDDSYDDMDISDLDELSGPAPRKKPAKKTSKKKK